MRSGILLASFVFFCASAGAEHTGAVRPGGASRAAGPSLLSTTFCKRQTGFSSGEMQMWAYFPKLSRKAYEEVGRRVAESYRGLCARLDDATFPFEAFSEKMFTECELQCENTGPDCKTLCRLERLVQKAFYAGYQQCLATPEGRRRDPNALASPFCQRGSQFKAAYDEVKGFLSIPNPDRLMDGVASDLPTLYQQRCGKINDAYYDEKKPGYPVGNFQAVMHEACDKSCAKRGKALTAVQIEECKGVCNAENYAMFQFRDGFWLCAGR